MSPSLSTTLQLSFLRPSTLRPSYPSFEGWLAGGWMEDCTPPTTASARTLLRLSTLHPFLLKGQAGWLEGGW